MTSRLEGRRVLVTHADRYIGPRSLISLRRRVPKSSRTKRTMRMRTPCAMLSNGLDGSTFSLRTSPDRIV